MFYPTAIVPQQEQEYELDDAMYGSSAAAELEAVAAAPTRPPAAAQTCKGPAAALRTRPAKGKAAAQLNTATILSPVRHAAALPAFTLQLAQYC